MQCSVAASICCWDGNYECYANASILADNKQNMKIWVALLD